MRAIAVLTLITVTGCAFGAGFTEPSMLNLKVPTGLRAGQLVLDIQHRMPLDFSWANIGIGLRYLIWSKLEANLAYTRHIEGSEIAAGAGYAYFVPGILGVQADVQYFQGLGTDSSRGLFGLVSAQSEPLFGILSAAVNAGFDASRQEFGLGAGLDAGFGLDFGPVKRVGLAAEYYPMLKADTARTAAWCAGLTFNTYGHHFMFTAGNAAPFGAGVGVRRMMAGSPGRDISVGFNIQRFLDFKTF